MIRKKVKKITLAIIVVIVFVVILFPPLMMLLTSIKTELDAMSFPPKWIFQPTVQNYTDIFRTSPLLFIIITTMGTRSGQRQL